MLSAGVPLIYIKDFLGHSSVVTTEIYAQVEAGQFVKNIKQDDLLDLKELNAKAVPNIPDYLKESKKWDKDGTNIITYSNIYKISE